MYGSAPPVLVLEQLSRSSKLPLCQRRNLPYRADTDDSIIGVPAIGADPRETWTTDRPSLFLGDALHDEIPSARILLYDHLRPEERRLEVKELSDPGHEATARVFADVEKEIAQYGTEEWADRLLDAVRGDRISQRVRTIPHGAWSQVNTRGGALFRDCRYIESYPKKYGFCKILFGT